MKSRKKFRAEVRKAKAIVADRAQIISEAQREAETIIRVAEEKQKALVNQDEVVRQAQAKANDLDRPGSGKIQGNAQSEQRLCRRPDAQNRRVLVGKPRGASKDAAEYQVFSAKQPNLNKIFCEMRTKDE